MLQPGEGIELVVTRTERRGLFLLGGRRNAGSWSAVVEPFLKKQFGSKKEVVSAECAKVTKLVVSGLDLEDVPEGALSGTFPNLEALDLSKNRFKTFPADIYALRKLKCLDLTYNVIATADTIEWTRFEALEMLNLGHNMIRSFPMEKVRTEFGKLARVGLALNLIDTSTIAPEYSGLCHFVFVGLMYQRVPSRIRGIPGDPQIFLGARDSTLLPEELLKLGITHVLSVGQRGAEELGRCARIKTKYIAIGDWPQEALLPVIEAGLPFMDEAVGAGAGVLVHCLAGQSRSASVVVAWLMARKGMAFDEAMGVVQASRYDICPNMGFREQLHAYEQSLAP